MTHRMEVEWVDLDAPEEEIRKEIEECQHSKIVCCHETMEQFAGVLLVIDYYKALAGGKEFRVGDLLKDPIVVHENVLAPKVLENLRQNNTHFSIVVDEYGDFEGIITLHDVMENIVGYILDEGEEEEPDYFVREDNSVLVNGDAPIEVLMEILDDFYVDYDQIDYTTVAGFVIEQMNVIPRAGDKIIYLDYTIEIMDMDANRIDKVLISKIKDENE